jgi:hypothetical protein
MRSDITTDALKIRKRILVASIGVPVLYGFLVCAHWLLEHYFRGWRDYHYVYEYGAPLVFFATVGLLFISPVIASLAVIYHLHFRNLAIVVLSVTLALLPIVFIVSRS